MSFLTFFQRLGKKGSSKEKNQSLKMLRGQQLIQKN